MKTRITLISLLALMLAAGTAMATPDDAGKLLTGPAGSSFTFTEPAEGGIEQSGVVHLDNLGKGVQSGYVVLREALGPFANNKVSDILILTADDHKPTNSAGDVANRAVLVSDNEGGGVTDAQLAVLAGPPYNLPLITLADINAGNNPTGFTKIRHEVHGPCTSWTPPAGGIDYSICSAGDASLPGVSPAILLLMFGLLAITGVLVLRRRRSGTMLA